MKNILLFLLIATLLLSFPVQGKEKLITNSLSPGIDVLKEQNELRKGNLFGSLIGFSQLDFQEAFSDSEFDSVTIRSLPNPEIGNLTLKGNKIKVGQVIDKKELDQMSLVPVNQQIGTTHIAFSKNGDGEIYRCRITFSDYESTQPSAAHLSLTTYQNIPINAQIIAESTGESVLFDVVETCKNGVLTLDNKDGCFIYTPTTNFNGNDRFYYRVIDEYGNKSQTMCAMIQIIKTNENLYFTDLAGKPEHRSAIFVCTEGIMNYTLDPNGLPCFSPNEDVCANDVIQFGMNALEGKKIIGKKERPASEVFHQDNGDEPITAKEAVMLLNDLCREFCDGSMQAFSSIEETSGGNDVSYLSRLECAVMLEQFFNAL